MIPSSGQFAAPPLVRFVARTFSRKSRKSDPTDAPNLVHAKCVSTLDERSFCEETTLDMTFLECLMEEGPSEKGEETVNANILVDHVLKVAGPYLAWQKSPRLAVHEG